MLKRILTALGILTVTFGFLLGLRQIHVAFVSALLLVMTVVAAYEMCNCLEKTGEYKPMKWVILPTAAIACVATYFFGYLGLTLTIVFSTILICMIFTFDHKYELKDLFSSVFILFYPIVPVSLLIHMNNFDCGLYAILLTIIIPIMTDTMAYFTGYLIGGPKLCPEISPKKTIAGAIGGIVGAIIGAVLIWLAFDFGNIFASFKNVSEIAITDATWKSILIYCALGIVAGPICEIGDLIASWIKRKAGIKDYGNIFPGHGGVMDRLDSIIVMIPIVLLFIEIMPTI